MCTVQYLYLQYSTFTVVRSIMCIDICFLFFRSMLTRSAAYIQRPRYRYVIWYVHAILIQQSITNINLAIWPSLNAFHFSTTPTMKWKCFYCDCETREAIREKRGKGKSQWWPQCHYYKQASLSQCFLILLLVTCYHESPCVKGRHLAASSREIRIGKKLKKPS